MDETQWAAYRRRLKTRVNAQMALIICPIGMATVTLAAATWHYPAGDVRNELLFRLGIVALFGVFLLSVQALAVRWLLRDRRT